MKLKNYSNRDLGGLVYVLPWILGLVVFQLYPFISSFFLSFTDKTLSDTVHFVGLKNYVYLFTKDKDFYQIVKVTLQYVAVAVPGRVAFALIIALILNADVKGINLFRTVYYLPSIFGSSVAISIIWRFLFQKQGAVNEVLGMLGIDPVNWLGNPKVALITVSIIPIWQFGSSMVLFLAALKNVPRSLYEAARMDGAGYWKSLLHVTLPMISPIVLFNLIMQSVSCFQEFSTAFNLTGGGPNKATFLYGIKLYREAFTNFKMGYASALSWVLFAGILGVTLVIFLSSRYWAFYEDDGKGN